MYLADGVALDVVGMEDVWILLPNGSVWLLEKVRHIPDLRRACNIICWWYLEGYKGS